MNALEKNCVIQGIIGGKQIVVHRLSLSQVFHSLLKAHTMEARAIVRQAMAILTPAVPARMEDGHQMLTHWTRKIIVEEGHTVPQLVHILHLIVQHFRVSRSGLGGKKPRNKELVGLLSTTTVGLPVCVCVLIPTHQQADHPADG